MSAVTPNSEQLAQAALQLLARVGNERRRFDSTTYFLTPDVRPQVIQKRTSQGSDAMG
jgi:hypothetical protein